MGAGHSVLERAREGFTKRVETWEMELINATNNLNTANKNMEDFNIWNGGRLLRWKSPERARHSQLEREQEAAKERYNSAVAIATTKRAEQAAEAERQRLAAKAADRTAIAGHVSSVQGTLNGIEPLLTNITNAFTDINTLKTNITALISNTKTNAQGKPASIVTTANSLDASQAECTRIVNAATADENIVKTARDTILSNRTLVGEASTAAAPSNADTSAQLTKAKNADALATAAFTNEVRAAATRAVGGKATLTALQGRIQTIVNIITSMNDMITTINNVMNTGINETNVIKPASESATAADTSATTANSYITPAGQALTRANAVTITTPAITAEKTKARNAAASVTTAATNARTAANNSQAQSGIVSGAYTEFTTLAYNNIVLTQANIDTATTLKNTIITATREAATLALNAATNASMAFTQKGIAETAATDAERLARDAIEAAATAERTRLQAVAAEAARVAAENARVAAEAAAAAERAAAAKTAARAEAKVTWMAASRPGCRNLVTTYTSVDDALNHNIQCNDNEYLYGFQSRNDVYQYTCCTIPKGAQGATGLPGFAGFPGALGTKGLRGDPGARGPAGGPGTRGAQGPVGGQGERGLQGSPGINSSMRYVAGPPGPVGSDGLIGPAGPKGPMGEMGTINQLSQMKMNERNQMLDSTRSLFDISDRIREVLAFKKHDHMEFTTNSPSMAQGLKYQSFQQRK